MLLPLKAKVTLKKCNPGLLEQILIKQLFKPFTECQEEICFLFSYKLMFSIKNVLVTFFPVRSWSIGAKAPALENYHYLRKHLSTCLNATKINGK